LKFNLHKSIRLYSLVLIILFGNILSAQTQLTGFFDVYNSFEFENEEYSGFQINQFELDISHTYKKCLSLGTALAYNSENEQFELAMAYLHYNMFNSATKHPRKEEERNHTAIMIGKFDVPFGLDYLLFASPDRPVFFQPLVIEKSIGGWNDVGVNFHTLQDRIVADLTIVNGFNGGVNITTKIEYGIFDYVDVGFSHASDFSSFDKRNNWANGVDLVAQFGDVQIKSEHIWSKGLLGGSQDTLFARGVNSGMYVQAFAELANVIEMPFFITLRYGFWKAANDYNSDGNDDQINRTTFGLGYRVSSGCSVRSEVQSDQVRNKNRNMLATIQLVAGF